MPPTGDERETAELLRTTLRREVGRLLVADVPVAVIVSGGLDSSLVTALAAERARHEVAWDGQRWLTFSHAAASAALRSR